MSEQATGDQRWFAGAGDDRSAGLDADYTYVVRAWVREPEKRPWGDVDYGESVPVCVVNSAELRDRIVADHDQADQLRLLRQLVPAIATADSASGWDSYGEELASSLHTSMTEPVKAWAIETLRTQQNNVRVVADVDGKPCRLVIPAKIADRIAHLPVLEAKAALAAEGAQQALYRLIIADLIYEAWESPNINRILELGRKAGLTGRRRTDFAGHTEESKNG